MRERCGRLTPYKSTGNTVIFLCCNRRKGHGSRRHRARYNGGTIFFTGGTTRAELERKWKVKFDAPGGERNVLTTPNKQEAADVPEN